jgi:hypothetical protein
MFQTDYDIAIVGAGPAGLMAAIESHRPSSKVLVLEKMHRPALKLRISGKGRCNITNDADSKEFIAHFGKNGRFLKFALAEFSNKDLLEYFERLGVRFKLERGGRYFPRSDSAVDVAEALVGKLKSLKIPVATSSEVKSIEKLPDGRFALSIEKKGPAGEKDARVFTIKTRKVLMATGGKSYPKTGSDGAGLIISSGLGHAIVPVFPSLVPIKTAGDTAKKLRGLSLKNVNAEVWCGGKKVDELFGEMLFTDFGVSGPVILSLSKTIVRLVDEGLKVFLVIDLKPALNHKMIDLRLLREMNEHGKQGFKNLLKRLLPGKMTSVFIEELKIPEKKPLNQLNQEERKRLRMLLKEFRLEITGYLSFDWAIVTAGGVSLEEVDKKTMESKIVKGLYFAGEIVDIDADTGGFNLQAAFSTGWIAGRAMREREEGNT